MFYLELTKNTVVYLNTNISTFPYVSITSYLTCIENGSTGINSFDINEFRRLYDNYHYDYTPNYGNDNIMISPSLFYETDSSVLYYGCTSSSGKY
jgi:hypothetical protein